MKKYLVIFSAVLAISLFSCREAPASQDGEAGSQVDSTQVAPAQDAVAPQGEAAPAGGGEQ